MITDERAYELLSKEALTESEQAELNEYRNWAKGMLNLSKAVQEEKRRHRRKVLLVILVALLVIIGVALLVGKYNLWKEPIVGFPFNAGN